MLIGLSIISSRSACAYSVFGAWTGSAVFRCGPVGGVRALRRMISGAFPLVCFGVRRTGLPALWDNGPVSGNAAAPAAVKAAGAVEEVRPS